MIPYGKQTIDEADIDAVVSVLRSPLLTQGPQVEQFEDELRDYLGACYVSVSANGTAALHLAYAALGLGPGDEIITSPITFSATASAAHSLGAKVRFADVEPDTGNIDVAAAEAHITENTRGIVAVHMGGAPADLAPLRALCDRYALWLLEDAAHAFGATYRGERIGNNSYSDAATFSFHPVKHITTCEGGAVSVREAELKRRIDCLRHHGICTDETRLTVASPGPWYYEVQHQGFNHRISDLSCALGRSQLRKQEYWLSRRRELVSRYRANLDRVPGVTLQLQRRDSESAYHLLIALIDFSAYGRSRAQVMDALREAGIGTQVHYIPLYHHPYYRQLYGELPDPPGVAAYYDRALTLPLYPALTEAEVDYTVRELGRALGTK